MKGVCVSLVPRPMLLKSHLILGRPGYEASVCRNVFSLSLSTGSAVYMNAARNYSVFWILLNIVLFLLLLSHSPFLSPSLSPSLSRLGRRGDLQGHHEACPSSPAADGGHGKVPRQVRGIHEHRAGSRGQIKTLHDLILIACSI